MTYVASIHMNTYNRSWAQGGTAGYYGLFSVNQENGYAYFVGTGTTTGAPLNRLSSITHSFTRIDIIAPTNDMVSLYKAKVKATTEFANAFSAYNGGIPSFPSPIRSSGNFVLPNNALPLVNIVLAGGGGGGGGTYHQNAGAGGGGGGGVVKLTAYQAVGTTSVTIGGGGGGGSGDNSHGTSGGKTSFGNVYALGGGGGLRRDNAGPTSGAAGEFSNGGGTGGNGAYSAVPGFTQTASTGLGTSGSPAYHGGHSGGANSGGGSSQRGGGGGGAGGAGVAGGSSSGGDGGVGHLSDIMGAASPFIFGAGANSHSHNGGHGSNGWERSGSYSGQYAHGGHSGQNGSGSGGDSGVVVIRYYIP
jgi:hypothetical protein